MVIVRAALNETPQASTLQLSRLNGSSMSQPTRTCPTCHTPLPGVAAFCYVCGSATPPGLHRETGISIAITRSGVTPADLTRKLQRALGPGYELGERIGAGGFAEVFKARDLRLKRDLAIKVLRPDLGLTPGMLQRFRREAETIATLRHPNIVPIYDVGEGEGLAFLIMPFIAGESLRAWIDRDGALPTDEVRRVLREAASGLSAAHERGVIHRDIKPENIMLEGRERRVLLMDFGIAKAVGGAEDEDAGEALTTTGIIIGTPQYMSPEQACGDKSIDARTDQYSLAVVGYRMISGSLPFEAESTRAMLYQQLVAEPTPLQSKVADVPPGIAEAIQRAMAKEPSERFASMVEFAAMIDADRSGTFLRITPAAPRPVRAWWRRPAVLGGSAIAAGIAVFATLNLSGALATSTADSTLIAPADSVVPAPDSSVQAALSGGATTTQSSSGSVAGVPPATRPADRGATLPRPAVTKTVPPPAPARAVATASCARAADGSDWTAAATACAREAASGAATAQRILGTMYDEGNGVPEDPTQAVAWYRRAAASDLEAKFLLARLGEIGRGTYAAASESVTLLREAAAGGHLRAQQTLAFRLENGAGIRKDEAEALTWYRRLAERGDAGAQLKVGEYLARGRGTPKNEAEALDWFKKAGDRGSAEGAWQASQAYFRGRGTAKDETAGMEWLRRAAEGKHAEAVKELKKRGG